MLNLTKGQKVDLTKGKPELKKLMVGLGWDEVSSGDDDIDCDASCVLLDENDKVIGVIDFCFAGIGNPNMDVSRVISRPVPEEFKEAFLNEFNNQTEINHMQDIWHDIDAGYADHIKTNFPEITLPSSME